MRRYRSAAPPALTSIPRYLSRSAHPAAEPGERFLILRCRPLGPKRLNDVFAGPTIGEVGGEASDVVLTHDGRVDGGAHLDLYARFQHEVEAAEGRERSPAGAGDRLELVGHRLDVQADPIHEWEDRREPGGVGAAGV